MNLKVIRSNNFEGELPSRSFPLPYAHSCHQVWDKNKVVAQAVLYINPNLSFESYTNVACFGVFHCPDNKTIASLLFQSLEEISRKEGAEYLIGPMNGSTWETYRWMRPSEFPSFLSEEKHPDYYEALALNYGFELIAEYQSSLQDLSGVRNTKIPVFPEGYTIRGINKEHLVAELQRIAQLSLKGFQHNFLYTPITEEEFVAKYSVLATMMLPDYVLLAEDEQQQLCGIIFAFPDLLNENKDTLILKTIVRLPGRKYAGIIHLLQESLYENSLRNGIRRWIHAYMWKSNASRALSEKFNGEKVREYVLVGMKL